MNRNCSSSVNVLGSKVKQWYSEAAAVFLRLSFGLLAVLLNKSASICNNKSKNNLIRSALLSSWRRICFLFMASYLFQTSQSYNFLFHLKVENPHFLFPFSPLEADYDQSSILRVYYQNLRSVGFITHNLYTALCGGGVEISRNEKGRAWLLVGYERNRVGWLNVEIGWAPSMPCGGWWAQKPRLLLIFLRWKKASDQEPSSVSLLWVTECGNHGYLNGSSIVKQQW